MLEITASFSSFSYLKGDVSVRFKFLEEIFTVLIDVTAFAEDFNSVEIDIRSDLVLHLGELLLEGDVSKEISTKSEVLFEDIFLFSLLSALESSDHFLSDVLCD